MYHVQVGKFNTIVSKNGGTCLGLTRLRTLELGVGLHVGLADRAATNEN